MTIFDDNFLMKIFDYIDTIFDNWKECLGDLIFETLITILIIENLNSVNHSYLTINCDTGQHSQFLRCFESYDQQLSDLVYASSMLCEFIYPRLL